MKRLIILAGVLTVMSVTPSRLRAQVQLISPQPWDTVFTPMIHFSWHSLPGAVNYGVNGDGYIYYGPDTEVNSPGRQDNGEEQDGEIDWSVVAVGANDSAILPWSTPRPLIYYPDGYPVTLASPANDSSDLSEPVVLQWQLINYTPPIYHDVIDSKLFLATDSATLISYELNGLNSDDGVIYNKTSVADSIYFLPSTTYYWAVESYNFRWITPVWKFSTSPSDPPRVLSPTNGHSAVPTPVQFWWNIEIPQNAKAVVARDSLLTQNVHIIDSSGARLLLDTSTKYFWQVINTNTGETSGILSFTTSNGIDTGLRLASVAVEQATTSQFRITYNSGIPTLTFESAAPGEIHIDAVDILGRVQLLAEQLISSPSGTMQIPQSGLKVLFYIVSENGQSYVIRAIGE